jgi:predicted transcriptional regulator
MATVLEMAAEIVSSHASTSKLSTDELLQEINKVFAALQSLETGKAVGVAEAGKEAKPAITIKQAFKKNEVICMVCGKGGMKTLTRHIKQAHDLKPGQYKKQFGIPSKQSLTAKDFSEARRKSAQERGLADNLAKAREVRAAKIKAQKGPAKTAAPAKPTKAKAAPKVVKAAPAKPVKEKVAKTKSAPKAKK